MGELEIRSSAEEAHREPGFLDLTGREIGRYRIQHRLGRGGVTTVYQAYDSVDGIPVALKVLLHGSDVKLYNRFRQEAQTAAKLRHEHIVRTLRVGVTPGTDTAYIAMDLVEGEDLAALLSRQRRLSPEDSCLLLAPIARALAYAHTQDVIHRDVKPSNILLRTVGSDHDDYVVLDALDYPIVPLLGDFGIARALDSPDLTSWGRTVGTPAFMAPEQARGARSVDQRADIYALGAVFYRCITGRQPFTGTTVQILHAHVYDEVTISDDVHRNLSQRHIEILQRTLAKDPNHRYASADELAEVLQRGANPATDQLTAAEREDQGTVTLEIRPPTPQSAAVTHFNVVVPGEQRPPLLASPGVAGVDGQSPMPTLGRQQPLDPNFNPELDQRLQTISALILSVLVTGIVVFLLYILLAGKVQPFGFLNTLERSMEHGDRTATFGSESAITENLPLAQPAVMLPSAMVPIPSLFSGSEINLRKAIPGLLLPPPLPNERLHTAAVLEPPPLPTSEALSLEVQPPAYDRFEPPPQPTRVHVPPTSTPRPLPPPIVRPTTSDASPIVDTISPPTSTERFDTPQVRVPCTTLIDPQLERYGVDFPAPIDTLYGCASDIAFAGDGLLLIYEHGFMIDVAALDLLFVSYRPVGDRTPAVWQLWSTTRFAPNSDERTPPMPPEEGRFYPSGMFAQAWRLGENGQRMGMAKMPNAERVPVIAQPFGESWIILLLAQGQINDPMLHIFANAYREY